MPNAFAQQSAGSAKASANLLLEREWAFYLDLEQLPKRKVDASCAVLNALQERSLSVAQSASLVGQLHPQHSKLLVEAGWVEATATAVSAGNFTFNEEHRLTVEQQSAVDAINQTSVLPAASDAMHRKVW